MILKARISNIEGLINTLPESINEESREKAEFLESMALIQKSIDRFKNTIQALIKNRQAIIKTDFKSCLSLQYYIGNFKNIISNCSQTFGNLTNFC